MHDVLDELVAEWRQGKSTALGTVVSTYRSAPRPAGASMLVTSDERAVGSVSGGCVEGGRTYAWRADLSAWRHSGISLIEDAKIVGQRGVEVSRDGRLYIRRRRRVWRSGAVQLPA